MESLILLTVVVLLLLAERFPSIRYRSLPLFRPFFATDLFYFLTGAAALGLVMRGETSQVVEALGLAGVPPSLLAAAAAVVLYDLGAYLSHLLLHRVEVLWELHKVHHSSRALDWLATFRGHILEHALRHALSPVLLLLLGFPPAAVGLAAGIYAAWAAFGHSNLRLDLAFLEPLLITPRLHRLHHVPATSERNLGTIFSVWDRLRGALVADPDARTEPIGVPGEIETYPQSWLEQLVEPLRRIGKY